MYVMYVIVFIVLAIIIIVAFRIINKSWIQYKRGLLDEPPRRFPFKLVRKALRTATNPEDIKELRQSMNLMYLIIGLWLLLILLSLFLKPLLK